MPFLFPAMPRWSDTLSPSIVKILIMPFAASPLAARMSVVRPTPSISVRRIVFSAFSWFAVIVIVSPFVSCFVLVCLNYSIGLIGVNP